MVDILQRFVAIISGIKLGGENSPAEQMALDSGILKIAVMIAALDGEITPGEHAAFEPLLKSCRSVGAKQKVTFEDLEPFAAHILEMARAGSYSDVERLEAFQKQAQKALPKGFEDGTVADLRRAFALWQVMAMSDGSVSELERAALRLLLADFVPLARGSDEPTHLLEPDFPSKVERVVGGLGEPATRAAAQNELLELVTTFTLKDGGKIRRHLASRVLISTLLGIAMAMAAVRGRVA